MRRGSFFIRIHTYLTTTRIGDLLVKRGAIGREALESALAAQKTATKRKPVGQILIDQGAVTRAQLYGILAEQWTLRGLAFVTGLMITAGSFSPRTALADQGRGFVLASARVDVEPIRYYPRLFGTSEKASRDISAFKKWTGVMRRFEQGLAGGAQNGVMAEWKQDLQAIANQPLDRMIKHVNDMMNAKPYHSDKALWGRSDYWGVPAEFLKKGGDCEDYAIAKFLSLKALGVPEDRMRLAIVHDKQLNIPHALLIVYGEGGAYVLDNQNERLLTVDQVKRYKPIYSINNKGWWLHSDPASGGETVLASAR